MNFSWIFLRFSVKQIYLCKFFTQKITEHIIKQENKLTVQNTADIFSQWTWSPQLKLNRIIQASLTIRKSVGWPRRRHWVRWGKPVRGRRSTDRDRWVRPCDPDGSDWGRGSHTGAPRSTLATRSCKSGLLSLSGRSIHQASTGKMMTLSARAGRDRAVRRIHSSLSNCWCPSFHILGRKKIELFIVKNKAI